MHAFETGVAITAMILLAALARAVFVYLFPFRECRWCRGRKRGRRCWRCHGSKQTRRIGAKTAHKVRLSLAQAWAERGAIRADEAGDGS